MRRKILTILLIVGLLVGVDRLYAQFTGEGAFGSVVNYLKKIGIYSGGTGAAKTNLIYTNTTSGHVGIWTSNPLSALHVANDTAGANVRLYRHDATASGAQVKFFHSRGTEAVPVVLNDEDQTGYLEFYGYGRNAGNTADEYTDLAKIVGEVDSKDAQGRLGGRLTFITAAPVAGTMTERMRITESGLVGIGTSTPTSTYGGLDIASGGLGLVIGADNNATTRTSNTTKIVTIAGKHYNSTEEPIGILYGLLGSANAELRFGGGDPILNAATNLSFYTGATPMTTTGTLRMRINEAGVVNINGTAGTAPAFIVTPPGSQTIAEGNTVTADACGALKKITAAGAVVTSTTDTFTTPAAGNTGCCMDVANVGAQQITLDYNANFISAGAANVVLGAGDTCRVCSDGTDWYQIGATGNN